jgi:hypothetical protein
MGFPASRRMRWAHVACTGEINAYNILVGKGKRPFKRTRCRWEDSTRMDLMETVWEGADWMHLAQDTDQ